MDMVDQIAQPIIVVQMELLQAIQIVLVYAQEDMILLQDVQRVYQV